jgi:ATP-dependent exoDNAse (exonuclease V) alpha subunit
MVVEHPSELLKKYHPLDDKGRVILPPLFTMKPTTFLVEGNYYLMRKQVPFKLGHSLTIHSSQGMSLSKAVVNAGKKIFSSAQTYVALSRLETLKGLTLIDFDPDKIRASESVYEFYRNLD